MYGLGLGGASQTKHVQYTQLVADIIISEKRELAMQELSKRREQIPKLASLIWFSFGTIAALLQEILLVYDLLEVNSTESSGLTATASNRVCNALALLQCVASDRETRKHFLAAQIPLYLYPLLRSTAKTKPFEYLRLTSLGVIGALVKVDEPDVIKQLLSSEIIPLSLRIMETGSDLSKTVATFIIQKILQDARGLEYICQSNERFHAVSTTLNRMIKAQAEKPELRLLKHVLKCYTRLIEHQMSQTLLTPRGLKELELVLNPTNVRTFEKLLQHDQVSLEWLKQLLYFVQFKQ